MTSIDTQTLVLSLMNSNMSAGMAMRMQTKDPTLFHHKEVATCSENS